MKRKKKIKLVYKCYFIGCNSFYNDFMCLQDHLQHTNHSFFRDKTIKCPVFTCSATLCKDQINSHCNDVHKTELLSDTIENCIEISANIQNLQVSHIYEQVEIKINNSVDISNCDDFYCLIHEMIKTGCLQIFANGLFKCRIWGCSKAYGKLHAYKAHIRTHKHSVSRLIKHSHLSAGVNATEIFHFLSLQKSVFCLDNITDFLYVQKDWKHSVLFKNDLQKYVNEVVQDNNLDSFINVYASIDTKNDQNIINRIFYKGVIHDTIFGCITQNYAFYNLKECITSIWKENGTNKIIIGTKPNCKFDSINNFDTMTSRIYILDTDLALLDTIELSYGHAKKIAAYESVDACIWYILFSDGSIRKISYKNHKCELIDTYTALFIDFQLYGIDTIFATDGFKIHKLVNGITVCVSEYFDSFVNSLCVRTSPIGLQNCKELEIDLLSEIREKIRNNHVICSTVNGKFYSLDINLQNRLCIFKGYYSHSLLYSALSDTIFFTDQLNMTSRMLNIGETHNTNTKFDNVLLYTCLEVDKHVYYGTYDGTLHMQNYKLKTRRPTRLYRYIKKGDTLFVLDSNKEIEYSKDINYECCIVGILHFRDNLYLFIRCGVILKMSIKHHLK